MFAIITSIAFVLMASVILFQMLKLMQLRDLVKDLLTKVKNLEPPF